MEGLVKGLTEVALDAVAGDDVDDARRSHSPSREEGSKSTWVQVVSSGHEEEAEAEPEAGGLNRWRSRKEENDNEGNEGGCETVGSGKRHQQHRQRRRPKKAPAETWSAFKRHADEQQYMDHAKNAVNVEPTGEELDDLSKACSKLWELDLNRLVPGKDYEIDCGGGKKEIISDNYEHFKEMICGLWFDLYGRGGVSDSSSAFEHERSKGAKRKWSLGFTTGFRQFYLEEAKGRVDYQGYIFPRIEGPHEV
ncbi:hypothetical protein MUK42_33223 [Musa troglodytarum]|uniref:EndoU domain-containing protein n=1 Tax=Musa troglodytarum TaxID=320322 RepID=A0A9E7F6T4_9LILI|nr:hypothetical protein MUK42_33223 [Musa troglodytarum]